MLAVLLLVVGCSSSEPQVVDESKGLSANDDSSDEGADDDDENPKTPELSDAVKDESEAGAIAAVDYYIDAYEYAYLTSDAESMQEIISEECDVCWQLMDVFDDRLDDGEYSINVEFSHQVIDELVRTEHGSVIQIDLQVNSHDVVDDDGVKIDHLDEQDGGLLFLLNHDKEWRIDDIVAKDIDD